MHGGSAGFRRGVIEEERAATSLGVFQRHAAGGVVECGAICRELMKRVVFVYCVVGGGLAQQLDDVSDVLRNVLGAFPLRAQANQILRSRVRNERVANNESRRGSGCATGQTLGKLG